MNEQIKEYIKNNLKILVRQKFDWDNRCLVVVLLLENEEISSDFISID